MDEGGAGLHIDVRNLVKRYGSREVLKGVSISVAANERVVLVGPNGSGKSTLVKVIMGLTRFDRGSVRVLGVPVNSRLFDSVRRFVGFMPEKVSLPGRVLVEDYLYIAASAKGCSDYGWIADALDLSKFYGYRVSALSQGYKRRLMLAAALLCNPRLLVLDEPYANIDVDTRFAIDAVLEEAAKGRTLLVTTHIRPGLQSFRLLTIIDGVIGGEAVYRGDYVEVKLSCAEGELTVELRAESGDLGEQLDKLNRLLKEESCTVAGVRLETFDKLLQRLIQGVKKLV